MRIKTFFAFVFSCASLLSMAQVVDVDTYTGKGITTIPLYTLKSGPLSFPISLINVSGGVKADANTGAVGTGWNISSGGSISRQMRGLPDDYDSVNASGTHVKQGWLFNNNSTTVGNFVPTADDNLTVSTDEQNDYNFLNSLGGFNGATMIDTEPDVFYISAPGISCSFVFNNSGQISFLGKEDFKITYVSGPTGIQSFSVLDDAGTTYSFGNPLSSFIQSTLKDDGGVIHNESDITHFKYQYLLYKNKVRFNDSWKLLSIKSQNGDEIKFEYAPTMSPMLALGLAPDYALIPLERMDQQEVNAYLYDESTGSATKKFQYSISRYIVPQIQFTKATGKTEVVKINRSPLILPKGDYSIMNQLIGSVEIYDNRPSTPVFLKQWLLNYDMVHGLEDYYDLGNGTLAPRYSFIFLRSLIEDARQTTFITSPYLFEYNGVDFTAKTILRSDRSTLNKDEYGFNTDDCCSPQFKTYVYPALGGIDRIRTRSFPGYLGQQLEIGSSYSRTVSIPALSVSSLSKIVLPTGGENRIFYEPNIYKDTTSHVDVYGGGLRVSRLEFHDGVDFANDIVKTYSYLQDDGTSSGVILHKPVYIFNLNSYKNLQTNAVTYYHDLVNQNLSFDQIWKRTLIRTNQALNADSDPGIYVGYKKVSVSQPGIGKTVYKYDVPGSFTNFPETDWTPTRNKIARTQPSSPNYSNVISLDPGPIVGSYAYPFAPNPNYDFKRGLLRSVRVFSETNALVKQTDYDYTFLSTPAKVYALRLDQYPAAFTYTSQLTDINGQTSYVTRTDGFPMFIYSRYEMNTGIHPRLFKTTTKVFDQKVTGGYETTAYQSNIETLEYSSTNHDKVTRRVQTGSDGVEYATNYKYAFDYSATALWAQQDTYSQGITRLKERNINIPVETWSTKKDGAESPLVISSNLSLFGYDATKNTVTLRKSLSMSSSKPVSSFTPSSIINGSASTFTYENAKYNRFTDYQDADAFGNPGTTVAYNKIKSSVHYARNSGVVKATFANTAAGEAAYTDFDSQSDYDFTCNVCFVNAVQSTGGRVNGPCLLLNPSPTKVAKTLTNKMGQPYTFSCWLKGTAGGTITVKVNDGASPQASSVISFPACSDWTYFSTSLPIGTFGSNITVTAETSVAVLIDDILFYPATAMPTTYLHGTGLAKIAETDAHGRSTYYEYDELYRLRDIKDNENNILKSYSYKMKRNSIPNIIISQNTPAYVNKPTTFSATDTDDLANTVYKWRIVNANDPSLINDFSNVSPISGTNLMNYTFTATGRYYVNVQCTYMGITKTAQYELSVDVVYEPLTVTICPDRPTTFDLCNPTETHLIDCNPDAVATPGRAILKALVTGGTGNYTYEWRKYDLIWGGFQEEVLSTSQSLTGVDYLVGEKYHVSVSDTQQPSAGGADITFIIYKSDPNCPTPVRN